MLNLNKNKPFKLIGDHNYVCGVLSGFAYSFELNVFLVRLIFLVLSLCMPIFIVIYFAFSLLADDWDTDPSDYESVTSKRPSIPSFLKL